MDKPNLNSREYGSLRRDGGMVLSGQGVHERIGNGKPDFPSHRHCEEHRDEAIHAIDEAAGGLHHGEQAVAAIVVQLDPY